MSLLCLPPLSLYIHIPWCIKKCPYCDFNSHTHHQIPEEKYVERLKNDIDQEILWYTSKDIKPRKFHSIFFGGGTPSLFSAQAIEKILHYAEKKIGFESNIEITLEANPGTFEQNKFSGYHSAGINRLSIGIQSFNEQQLHKLGRIHSAKEAQKAVNIAQKAGFQRINLDLMHGLPEQTIEAAQHDLHMAIDLSPQHISWYQLTIEPNTVFYRQPPPLPNDDILADIQHHGQQLLESHDFTQYEISAFSQSTEQARHNVNYWQFGDYMGIGAGAHGKWTDTCGQSIIRRQKTRLPEHYLQKTGTSAPINVKQHTIATSELALEFMMNALRLNNGIARQLFTQRTGLDDSAIADKVNTLQQQGLLENNSERLKATPMGQRFLNSVLANFDQP